MARKTKRAIEGAAELLRNGKKAVGDLETTLKSGKSSRQRSLKLKDNNVPNSSPALNNDIIEMSPYPNAQGVDTANLIGNEFRGYYHRDIYNLSGGIESSIEELGNIPKVSNIGALSARSVIGTSARDASGVGYRFGMSNLSPEINLGKLEGSKGSPMLTLSGNDDVFSPKLDDNLNMFDSAPMRMPGTGQAPMPPPLPPPPLPRPAPPIANPPPLPSPPPSFNKATAREASPLPSDWALVPIPSVTKPAPETTKTAKAASAGVDMMQMGIGGGIGLISGYMTTGSFGGALLGAAAGAGGSHYGWRGDGSILRKMGDMEGGTVKGIQSGMYGLGAGLASGLAVGLGRKIVSTTNQRNEGRGNY